MNLKKPILIILSSLVLISLFSCDRIEQPIPTKTGGLDWDLFPNGDSTNYTWPTWTPNTNTFQNVLLEDFTGHTCTNCPAAAVIAKGLEDANPGRVIIASIHASVGNAFQALSPPEFTTDFTTEEGNLYANEIPSFFGNPSGMINRQGGGLSNTLWYLSSAWTNKTNSTLSNSPKANIQVQLNYFPQTRGLFVHTESEFLSNLTEEHSLVNYLIRKVVIAPQKLANGSTEEEYHHHNVMSGTINGAWGTSLGTEFNTGDKIYNNFAIQLPDNSLDSTYTVNNLSIITYIYNKSTYEIIQVTEIDL